MPMRLIAFLTVLVLLYSGCGSELPSVSRSDVLSGPEIETDVSTPVEPPVSTLPPAPPVPTPPPAESNPPATVPAPEPVPSVEVSDSDPVPEPPAPVEPVYEDSVPAIQIPADPAYDFSAPVPEGPDVETDYFADAAFVGDSRTEGFWLYSGVKQGKLLCATGLTVFSIDTKQATGSSETVLDAVCSGHFGKIYLGFGLNELGYIDTNSFIQTYCQLIDTIRAAQPQAVIYIQNLIPVNDAQARASNHKGHVNCERIRLYNEMIAGIAQEKQLPLLDLYSAFAVDGQLPAEASRDGVHLLPSYCKKQLEFLTSHTVTPEQLTAPAAPVVPVPSGPTEAADPEAPIEPELEVTEP